MFSKVKSLFRVTAVRLSIIYTLIFGIIAVGIVFYMTGATVNVLREQYQASIDQEIDGLARVYNRGGVNSLVRTLDRRSRAPGANLYVVTTPQGQIIAGNVPRIKDRIMQKEGWTKRAFPYERYDDQSDREHRAIARVVEIPNGMRILVGRDIGEYEDVREIVGKGFKLAIGSMLALGLLTWFFVGRRALKRIDIVSKSSQRIMDGDKTERLPIIGVNDEFDRLSGSLNKMLDQINHLDDGVKQMSDNIAHDLKTPITRLRNKAEEAYALQSEPEVQQEKIADIIDDCEGIVKTFNALLMISRVETGSTVAKMEILDPSDLVGDVYELYEAVVEDAGKTITLNIKITEKAIINANRELLSQAISNLIDNAIKYGGEVITLSATSHERSLLIQVADNGTGIREEDRAKAVQRFVRLDQSRSKAGNGLGLSLVKAIAEMHKGKLELKDNKPGLLVEFTIPLKSV
jgi:signal transduction histidine kinase